MTRLVIGIDPGCKKGHAVALYIEGTLRDLFMAQHEDLREWLIDLKEKFLINDRDHILVSVEHSEQIKTVFRAKSGRQDDPKARAKAARMGKDVGKVQEATRVLVDMIQRQGIDVVAMSPSSTWKSPKAIPTFQRQTGWMGRTNADHRSAAFMGYQALDMRGAAIKLARFK